MDSKENPSSESRKTSPSPVEAILVRDQNHSSELDSSARAQSSVVSAQLVEESREPDFSPLNPKDKLPQENLAAKGGAVASIVLGILAIVGATVTWYSIINALLGAALGFWGMSSNARWPLLGPILCLVGIFACIVASAAGS